MVCSKYGQILLYNYLRATILIHKWNFLEFAMNSKEFTQTQNDIMYRCENFSSFEIHAIQKRYDSFMSTIFLVFCLYFGISTYTALRNYLPDPLCMK